MCTRLRSGIGSGGVLAMRCLGRAEVGGRGRTKVEKWEDGLADYWAG